MNNKKVTGSNFSFLIKKTRAFLAMCTGKLNENFIPGMKYMEIVGPVSGVIYFFNPSSLGKKIKFQIKREELKNLMPGVTSELPDIMYFV